MPKKTAGLLPKNRKASKKKAVPVEVVSTPEMPEKQERPRDANIRKAEGGYIIRLGGGSKGWNDDEIVKEKLADGLSEVQTWLDGKEEKKKE